MLTLNQLLQEVEVQAIQSQQQINVVKAQIQSKQRESRLNTLTTNELKSLSNETKIYEGVGKMWGCLFVRDQKLTVSQVCCHIYTHGQQTFSS